MLDFTFYQDGTELNFSFEVNPSNARKVSGTVLFELFKWIDIQKQMGAKGLSLAKPINIRIKSDTLALDTGEARKQLAQKLKLNSTNKSKRKFAARFQALTAYMSSPITVVDYEEVITLLED